MSGRKNQGWNLADIPVLTPGDFKLVKTERPTNGATFCELDLHGQFETAISGGGGARGV